MHGTDAPSPNASAAPVDAPIKDQMKRDIPVLGTAAGSSLQDNGFHLMAEPMDFVRRPSARKRQRHLRAIY